MSAISASDTVVLFLPEVFDSQLVADERKEPVWPNALLRNQSSRFPTQRLLGEILGALKLRAGSVIETFGVPQAYGRLRAQALKAGFSSDQLLAWGYDWRRTPAEIAQDLLTRPAPPGEGKIIILGHGYGGLVAKTLMQAGPIWRDRVEGILYLGAPHAGCDIERIAAITCPFGWLSPTALRVLSDPQRPVPLRSLAAMARPWAYEVPLTCPGMREIDVFSRCYETPMLSWEDDSLMAYLGDGLHLMVTVVLNEHEHLESDRFHADLPSCPKMWLHLAEHALGRPKRLLEIPGISAAMHVQRSQVEAGALYVGLRFRGEPGIKIWIRAEEMSRVGGRFAPSQDEARTNEEELINNEMTLTNRLGHYTWLDLTDFRKFVRLSLWASAVWDDPVGVPVFLDERLVYVCDPGVLDPEGLNGLLGIFLGSAAHWLGQRPIANPKRLANRWRKR
jgi:pimeloyl-ACP methyl ester carboxylesterase